MTPWTQWKWFHAFKIDVDDSAQVHQPLGWVDFLIDWKKKMFVMSEVIFGESALSSKCAVRNKQIPIIVLDSLGYYPYHDLPTCSNSYLICINFYINFITMFTFQVCLCKPPIHKNYHKIFFFVSGILVIEQK